VETHKITRFLAEAPLLTDIPLKVEEVAVRHLLKGQEVNDRLDNMSAVCFIMSGRVDVYSISPDSREIRLNTLTEGDCFGIQNLFEEGGMETFLRCGQPAEVIFIPKVLLVNAAATNPAVALRFLRFYSGRLRFLLRRIEALTMQTSRGKLAAFLLTELEGTRVSLSVPREELAKMLGVSRAALFRELAHLQELSLIAVDGHDIIVPDREALAAILYQED
jgi:CRP-like cAMP-binding protein